MKGFSLQCQTWPGCLDMPAERSDFKMHLAVKTLNVYSPIIKIWMQFFQRIKMHSKIQRENMGQDKVLKKVSHRYSYSQTLKIQAI